VVAAAVEVAAVEVAAAACEPSPSTPAAV